MLAKLRARLPWAPRLALLAALVIVPLAGPGTAAAQSTGSSFGGGSFGGGGGSSSWSGGGGGFSGGSSWSGGGSSWSGGGSYSSGGYSSGGGLPPGVIITLVVVFLFISFVSGKAKGNAGYALREPDRVSWDRVDVTGVTLALDWRARKWMQGELERLAREGDTSTTAGLARLARETALALRRYETAWLYAGVLNASLAAPGQAEQTFRNAAQDFRSRYRHELVRKGATGQVREKAAPGTRARDEEGQGLVVVTLLVAAKRELLDVYDIQNAEQLRRLLAQIVAMDSGAMVALEVIWSPAEETDRMSSAELEVLYPELRRLREDTVVGRVFCSHCSGPFARELQVCPHCGAANDQIVPTNPPPQAPPPR